MTKIILLAVVVLGYGSVSAQVKVAASAGAPHNSAILELESNAKGFLLPRMTTAQRSAISSPANGLVVFNVTLGCVEMYNGGGWNCLTFTAGPKPAAQGSTYTTFSNGTAMFSTNTTCSSKLISAGSNAANCSSTVVVGSNSYNMVHINGQCWMQTNLNEAPSNYAYNNTWLNTTLGDLGRWGYYNTTTTNGSAGFQAAEPAVGEGLLYQWSAAMNGSTAERAQGACPDGWHVPSDCEWMYLEHGLGMSITDQPATGLRSSGAVGGKLSTKTVSGTGSNSSGFTGLLGGFRASAAGSFGQRNSSGIFWSSSSSSTTNAYSRTIFAIFADVSRSSQLCADAMPVRCLRD